MDPSIGVTLRRHEYFGQKFRIYSDSDSALAPTTEREFQFVAALRTQLASREWKLVTGPSACGSIVTTRLHPHHEQGYIVALRLPVRERGHLFQNRIDDLFGTLAAARL